MADITDLLPLQSTPENDKLRRDYAKALMDASIAPGAKSWGGVIAHALMGLGGGMQQQRALQGQLQGLNLAAQQNQNPTMLQGAGLTPPAGGNALGAISKIESGGDYGAVGPPTRDGDRAYGKYQVMGKNVGPWTKEVLGQEMTPEQFRASPQAQEAVAHQKFGEYTQKYGPVGAAKAWFAGEQGMNNPNAQAHTPQGVPFGPTVAQYGQKFSQNFNPQGYAGFQQNPYANPKEQDLARGLIAPEAQKDIYGRPYYTAPLAQNPTAPAGGPTPGFTGNVSVSPEGAVSVPTAVTPGGAQNVEGTAKQAFDMGQRFRQAGAVGAGVAGQVSTDVRQAADTPAVQQTLGMMKDEILKHGDKMVWGPASDWVNNLKKNIAQFAPGLMSQADLDGLASADSFEKLSALLQTMVGRQVGSTDASLFQGMKSVPGSHNSKEGALALIDMLGQVYRQQQRFIMGNMGNIGQPGFNYLDAKNKFFEANPIVNPITKNPIRLDLSGGGGTKNIVDTRVIGGKTYYKLDDGKWHDGL